MNYLYTANDFVVSKIASSGSNLWIMQSLSGFLGTTLWRTTQADPTTATEFDVDTDIDPLRDLNGLTVAGSDLWMTDANRDSVWRVAMSDTENATEFQLTSIVIPPNTDPIGDLAAGSSGDLWVSYHIGGQSSVWRVPQINPGATECAGVNTLSWRYVTP